MQRVSTHSYLKYSGLLCIALLISMSGFSQENSDTDDFESFRKELLGEFNDFRREANEEYLGFLNQSWEEFTLFKGKKQLEQPKPDSLIRYNNKEPQVVSHTTEAKEIVPITIIQAIPQDVTTQIATLNNTKETGTPLSVPFYGTSLKVRYQGFPSLLSSVKEEETMQLWKRFSTTAFAPLLLDLLNHKKKMQLNDWAYFLLIKQVAQSITLFKDENSKLVFQHFLLVQSGYDVRLARVDNFLSLLLPFYQEVYSYPFLKLDGKSFYVFSNKKLTSYSTCYSYKIPQEIKKYRPLSLLLKQAVLFPVKAQPYTIRAADMEIKGEINIHTLNFYRDYPPCEISVHAGAVPDETFRLSLLNSIKKQLQEKDSVAILNKLLLWTQTGFKYQTDQKQFGYEKPFFIEENFYYPYNDCEDRSILFAWLVQQLLGMDVVLLNYPNHIATAVYINKNIPGDYISIQQKKYIICDPTFINATAGRCMLKYKEERPRVMKLK